MIDSKERRQEFVDDALYKFRNGMAREFYYNNDDISCIPYYYDADDDSLHADEVSVPFHYKEDKITNRVIYDTLELLDEKLREHYRSKGIELYDYD